MDNYALQQLFTFKSIFEGLEDAVICHDLDLAITNWNPAAERLFGYTAPEVIGLSMLKLMGEAQYPQQTEMLRDLLDQGRRISQLHTLRLTRDGREVPVAITLSPVSDEDGTIIGASQIIRDVSSEKLAQEQQAILAAIISGSEDAIISKTLGGIITSWNKGAENIFGYKAEEVIGK